MERVNIVISTLNNLFTVLENFNRTNTAQLTIITAVVSAVLIYFNFRSARDSVNHYFTILYQKVKDWIQVQQRQDHLLDEEDETDEAIIDGAENYTRICEWEGCNQIIDFNYDKHRENCKKRAFECKIKDCKKALILSLLEEHIQNEHPEYISETHVIDRIHYIDMDESFEERNYMQCYKKLFRGWSRISDERKCQFSIWLVGPVDEARNYRYTVQVFNASKGKWIPLDPKNCDGYGKSSNEIHLEDLKECIIVEGNSKLIAYTFYIARKQESENLG